MKWRPLLALGLLASPAISWTANPQSAADPVSVDGICGRLVASDAQQKANPFDHARVRLFSPVGGSDCCTLMTPVSEATAGRDGSFQFRKPSPGDYWLVATLGGRDYKILIRYEPGKKGTLDCSKFVYTLEKGVLLLKGTAKAAD